MTFEEFKEYIFKKVEDAPKCLRKGQAIFNWVDEHYGDTARIVQFEYGIDCFYVDKHIDEFLEKIFELIQNPTNL